MVRQAHQPWFDRLTKHMAFANAVLGASYAAMEPRVACNPLVPRKRKEGAS